MNRVLGAEPPAPGMPLVLLEAAAPPDAWVTSLAEHLVAAGVTLERCAVPVEQATHATHLTGDPSDVESATLALLAESLGRREHPFALGGFSRQARWAAQLCAERLGSAQESRRAIHCRGPHALVAFGYPFHAHGLPHEQHGLSVLERVTQPTLVVQGSRDSHGSETEARAYALPPNLQLRWLEDGNHRLAPRARTGLTQAGHLRAAAEATASFLCELRSLTASPPGQKVR